MAASDQFAQQASQLALHLGIKNIVIAVRDPTTRAVLVIASPGAMDDLREPLAEKLGLALPGETGWDG